MKGVGWAFALLLSFGSLLSATATAEDFPVREYSFGSAAIGRGHHDHAIRHSVHRDRQNDETASADLLTLKPEAIDMLESDVTPKDKVFTAEALSATKKRHDKNLRSQGVSVRLYLQQIFYSSQGCVQTSTTSPPITSAYGTALNLCMQFSAGFTNSPYGKTFGDPAPSNRQFPTSPTYVMYSLLTSVNPYSNNTKSNPYLPNVQNPYITSNNYPIVIQEKFFSDIGCTKQLSLNPKTGYPGAKTNNFNITSGCQNKKSGGYSPVTGLNYYSVSSSIVQNVNVPETGLLVSRYDFFYCFYIGVHRISHLTSILFFHCDVVHY